MLTFPGNYVPLRAVQNEVKMPGRAIQRNPAIPQLPEVESDVRHFGEGHVTPILFRQGKVPFPTAIEFHECLSAEMLP
jgi:hypothetical protein